MTTAATWLRFFIIIAFAGTAAVAAGFILYAGEENPVKIVVREARASLRWVEEHYSLHG